MTPPGFPLEAVYASVVDPTFFGGLMTKWFPEFQARRIARTLVKAWPKEKRPRVIFPLGDRFYEIVDSVGRIEPWKVGDP